MYIAVIICRDIGKGEARPVMCMRIFCPGFDAGVTELVGNFLTGNFNCDGEY